MCNKCPATISRVRHCLNGLFDWLKLHLLGAAEFHICISPVQQRPHKKTMALKTQFNFCDCTSSELLNSNFIRFCQFNRVFKNNNNALPGNLQKVPLLSRQGYSMRLRITASRLISMLWFCEQINTYVSILNHYSYTINCEVKIQEHTKSSDLTARSKSLVWKDEVDLCCVCIHMGKCARVCECKRDS